MTLDPGDSEMLHGKLTAYEHQNKESSHVSEPACELQGTNQTFYHTLNSQKRIAWNLLNIQRMD